MSLRSLIDARCGEIRAAMRETATPVDVTPRLKKVLYTFLERVDGLAYVADGTSETQSSSRKTERMVMDLLGVPELIKTDKKKDVMTLPPFVDDCFGFERTRESRNECRFRMPSGSGVYAIHSPYGSQANPDVLLVDIEDGKIVSTFGLEVKSGGPTWNTHIQFTKRNLLYIAFKDVPHYFFGDHIRTKDSWIYAIVWDELQRELAKELNSMTMSAGLPNMCVPYPKQEFRKCDLMEGRSARHAEIRQSFAEPCAPQTAPEPHSLSA
jgi:hypothetical protein